MDSLETRASGQYSFDIILACQPLCRLSDRRQHLSCNACSAFISMHESRWERGILYVYNSFPSSNIGSVGGVGSFVEATCVFLSVCALYGMHRVSIPIRLLSDQSRSLCVTVRHRRWYGSFAEGADHAAEAAAACAFNE